MGHKHSERACVRATFYSLPDVCCTCDQLGRLEGGTLVLSVGPGLILQNYKLSGILEQPQDGAASLELEKLYIFLWKV